MSYTQGQVDIKDASGTSQPIDAAIVSNSGSPPSTGQSARQIMAVGDPSTPDNVAAVDANSGLYTRSSKTTVIDTTTPLAGNASWNASGTFNDSQADGTVAVVVTVKSDVGGTLWIDQTNDTSLTSYISNSAAYLNNPNFQPLAYPILARYWRIRYVNNSTAQTTFEISHTAFPYTPLGINCAGYQVPSQSQITTVVDVYNTVNVAQSGTWGNSLTKGTQSLTGWSIQQLKDAGRTRVAFHCSGIASVVSETVLSCFKNFGGTETSGQTTYTVTAGKTLRIQSVRFSIRFATPSTTVTFANSTLRLREASVTGPQVIIQSMENPANLDNQAEIRDFPDGLEFPGGTILNFTQQSSATTLLIDAGFIGYEY